MGLERVGGAIQQHHSKIIGVKRITDNVRYLLDQLVDIKRLERQNAGQQVPPVAAAGLFHLPFPL